MDKIHAELLFASRPSEVYRILIKAKSLQKHYDDLEEWKQKIVSEVYAIRGSSRPTPAYK